MRCLTLAALVGLALAASLASARPPVRAERGPTAPYTSAIYAEGGGLLGSANQDTVYFGGTVWDPIDGRWEGYLGGTWTFDSGIGSDFDHSAPDVYPFKDTSLHAHMEGWVGYDGWYREPSPFFRRLEVTDPRWDGSPCVGAPAGLTGNASLWAGYFIAEADSACFAAGVGYPNWWIAGRERTFAYPGAGNVTLSFEYAVDMEPGFDYARILVDSGAGDPVEVAAYDGTTSGSASILLTPGVELPLAAGPFTVIVRVESDGAYSDEDGLYVSTCGAFAIDEIALTGSVTYGPEGFETDDGGWTPIAAEPGPAGDLSQLVHLDDLVPGTYGCGADFCGLEDSVLVLADLSNPANPHPLFQENLAGSPWIELGAYASAPIKFIEFAAYGDQGPLNYVYPYFNVMYYPMECWYTGEPMVSPWTSYGFIIGYPPSRFCSAKNTLDFSYILTGPIEEVRVGVGVLSYCRFFANCTASMSTTPWYDNVRFGVAGVPGAPFLSASVLDLPQDAFPEAGDLDMASPGRLDCNNVKGDSQPEAFTSLGDTLIVIGTLSDPDAAALEVRVQFAVDPGPGIDMLRLGTWLARHQAEGTWLDDRNGSPLPWFSARMDTAIQGNVTVVNTWATLYHELDPNFSGNQLALDPNDLDPRGQATRKLNDIFPDDLFTPGTRVQIFYKGRYLDETGTPLNSLWAIYPDTAGGNYLEAEILPSSMDAEGNFNCVLYVNHFDGRPGETSFEEALATTLPGGGGNAEDTAYDRYDVRYPWGRQASLGRPFGTEYGATGPQLLGYRTIVWHTGNLSAFNLVEEDAQALEAWYTWSQEPRNLYLTGDGVAKSMTVEAIREPTALELLETRLGVEYLCDAVRNAGCPGGSPADSTDCVPLAGSGGGHFAAGATWLPGNGCPLVRSYDVLGVSPRATGDARGNLTYEMPIKGSVSHASVSHVQPGGHRSVVDGFSTAWLLGAACASPSATQDRLAEVFTWFGETGAGGCYDTGATLGVDEDPAPGPRGPVLALRLRDGAFLRGAARFHLTAPVDREVRLEIYDVAGRRVAEVFRGKVPASGLDTAWDPAGIAASGVYFARLTGAETITRRFVVLR